jgi:hypothetical protein
VHGIVTENPAGGDGNQSTPAMSAAKHGIAGGVGNLGGGTSAKTRCRKSSTAPLTSALAASKSTVAFAPDRTAPVMCVSPDPCGGYGEIGDAEKRFLRPGLAEHRYFELEALLGTKRDARQR